MREPHRHNNVVCVHCGKFATAYNEAKQPTCGRHRLKPVKDVNCPNCEGPMMLRQGKYGYFWGCMNYPKCMGKRNVEDVAGVNLDRD
ncbi:MAG: topoisomerase DNA-binding C4 zinc finger domain-containing protein [Candidatus Altiarchaeota archaeon]